MNIRTRTTSLGSIGVFASALLISATPASGANVGYYDMVAGAGQPYQVAPITAAGETAIQIIDLSAAELASIDALFVLNPSNGGYGAEWVGALGNITAAVNSGLVLCFAGDRRVTEAASNIPGGSGISFTRGTFAPVGGPERNIDIIDNTTLVTNGPGGTVTNTNLDGGNFSNHGFATIGTLPAGNKPILSNGVATQAVTFSYPQGDGGAVVYSTVPLDAYLKGGIFGSPSASANLKNIYAPNMVAFCASLIPQLIEVEADDCTAGGDGCAIATNADGDPAVIIELPDGFVPEEGDEISATSFTIFDTRANEFGLCDGTELVLFGGALVIPGFLCAPSPFVVVVTDTNFDITDGTIAIEMFPDAFFADAATCNIPIVGDPQAQDIVVWQDSDKTQLVEGRAIEITDGCGSSRGRSRRLSFYATGLEYNFGINHMIAPEAVEQEFINVTSIKLGFLQDAVEKARPALNNGDFKKLMSMAKAGKMVFDLGNYEDSLDLMRNFQKFVERAKFDTTLAFNNFGNLRMRSGNIIFMIEVKVIPLAP